MRRRYLAIIRVRKVHVGEQKGPKAGQREQRGRSENEIARTRREVKATGKIE